MQLDALRQGKAPIGDYVAAYRRIAVALPMTDAATMLHAFRRGLSPLLAAYMHQLNPATIEDAITLVVRMGGVPHGGAGMGSSVPMDLAGLHGDDGAHAQRSAPAGSDHITRDDLAMILAAIQSNHRASGGGNKHAGGTSGTGGGNAPKGRPSIPGFSDEKVKEYMDAGKCFNCGQTDHRSRQCPLPRQNGGGGKASQKN